MMEEKQMLLPVRSFIILNLATFNLYSLWWMYKAWTFFKYRETYSIKPAFRAIFGIFYLHGLLGRIKKFSEGFGHQSGYNSWVLYLAIVVLQFAGVLPDYFVLIGLLPGFLFARPVESLNAGIRLSGDYDVEEQSGFNTRQIVLLVIGGLMWLLILAGILLTLAGV